MGPGALVSSCDRKLCVSATPSPGKGGDGRRCSSTATRQRALALLRGVVPSWVTQHPGRIVETRNRASYPTEPEVGGSVCVSGESLVRTENASGDFLFHFILPSGVLVYHREEVKVFSPLIFTPDGLCSASNRLEKETEMKRAIFASFALVACLLWVVAAQSQPPDAKGGGKKGDKGEKGDKGQKRAAALRARQSPAAFRPRATAG